MNKSTKIRLVDLKGCAPDESEIEFIRAELPPPGIPFTVVRYAIAGNNELEEYGLRLDLDKGVFIDHFENDNKKEAILKNATEEIISCINSAIADKPLSEEELDGWIKTHSKYSARVRKERLQTGSILPTEEDIRYAEETLAYDILDGRINFIRRIAPSSYGRLEKVWLWECKFVSAYLIWEDRRGGIDPESQEMDYKIACEHIRDLLIEQVKGTKSEFQEIKKYLEMHYLDPDGKVNETKARDLITRKATRIRDKKIDVVNPDNAAKQYVKMFYENIIPAVLDEKHDNVLKVLKAFEYSKAIENRFLIINCFEAALAIYFLNSDIIKSLWDKGLIRREDSL